MLDLRERTDRVMRYTAESSHVESVSDTELDSVLKLTPRVLMRFAAAAAISAASVRGVLIILQWLPVIRIRHAAEKRDCALWRIAYSWRALPIPALRLDILGMFTRSVLRHAETSLSRKGALTPVNFYSFDRSLLICREGRGRHRRSRQAQMPTQAP